MSRVERLLELMQCLRRRRRAVSGKFLADEMGVSLRTLYRDIASLQAQGALDGLTIVRKPQLMDFGHTFTALDPDGHRLRVYCLHGAASTPWPIRVNAGKHILSLLVWPKIDFRFAGLSGRYYGPGVD